MRKKINHKGFSLIELIIATAILSIAVFGVYKLIGENTKIISNNDNYKSLEYINYNLKECIKNIGYTGFPDKNIGRSYNINFGDDLKKCELGNTYTVNYNNINYQLSLEIIDSGTDFIDFNLNIIGEGVGNYKDNYYLSN